MSGRPSRTLHLYHDTVTLLKHVIERVEVNREGFNFIRLQELRLFNILRAKG